MPLHIVRDDIANMRTDAIVVPANPSLLISGGAGEAVARVAGMGRMQRACDELGGCPVGSAVVTPAFDFPAKMIVHAVGPVWEGGRSGEADALYSCVSASLAAATSAGAASIAMPLLATGAFGYPAGQAIDIETRAIQGFLERNEAEVWLVLYDRESMRAGRSLFDAIAEYIDDVYVGEHGFAGTARLDGRASRAEKPGMHAAPHARPDAAPAMPAATSDSGSLLTSRSWGLFKGRRARRDKRPLAEPFKGSSEEVSGESQIGTSFPSGKEPARGKLARGATTVSATASGVAVPEDAPPLAAAPASLGEVSRGGAAAPGNLAEQLAHLDESFARTVLRLIDERSMTDVEVYKRANMSRQLFAKIRKDDGYRPTKKTACALAFALGLNHDEAVALLARAGFALSHSSKFDVIVEYFLVNDIHDIFQVNEVLFAYDQPILG